MQFFNVQKYSGFLYSNFSFCKLYISRNWSTSSKYSSLFCVDNCPWYCLTTFEAYSIGNGDPLVISKVGYVCLLSFYSRFIFQGDLNFMSLWESTLALLISFVMHLLSAFVTSILFILSNFLRRVINFSFSLSLCLIHAFYVMNFSKDLALQLRINYFSKFFKFYFVYWVYFV